MLYLFELSINQKVAEEHVLATQSLTREVAVFQQSQVSDGATHFETVKNPNYVGR